MSASKDLILCDKVFNNICDIFNLDQNSIKKYSNYLELPLTGEPYGLSHLDLLYLLTLGIEKYGYNLVKETLQNDTFYTINNIVQSLNMLHSGMESEIRKVAQCINTGNKAGL